MDNQELMELVDNDEFATGLGTGNIALDVAIITVGTCVGVVASSAICWVGEKIFTAIGNGISYLASEWGAKEEAAKAKEQQPAETEESAT